MSNSLDKKELEAWENFLYILENNLPGFVKPWINSLQPALPLFEESENGDVSQEKYSQKSIC